MPNPGKSLETKIKLGAKISEPTITTVHPIDSIPDPRRRLEESGLQFWRQVFAAGQTWLKDSDMELLQIVCEQLDERDSLRAYVLENIEAWHERAALRNLERDISDNLSQLGFTPQSRAKLGIQEIKAKSKLEELAAKLDG